MHAYGTCRSVGLSPRRCCHFDALIPIIVHRAVEGCLSWMDFLDPNSSRLERVVQQTLVNDDWQAELSTAHRQWWAVDRATSWSSPARTGRTPPIRPLVPSSPSTPIAAQLPGNSSRSREVSTPLPLYRPAWAGVRRGILRPTNSDALIFVDAVLLFSTRSSL